MAPMKKQANRWLSIFLIVNMITALIGFAQPSEQAQAANPIAPMQQTTIPWFDPLWSFRRPVGIASPCGADVTDYQVSFELDSSFDFSKANPDGSDLRVTAEDGTTLLPFWIEEWDPVGGAGKDMGPGTSYTRNGHYSVPLLWQPATAVRRGTGRDAAHRSLDSCRWQPHHPHRRPG